MITDPIHRDLKGVLAQLLEPHKDLPLYVAGSGLFTIERIATKIGYKEIHSSDFCLPGCLLGQKLLGETEVVKVIDKNLDWMNEYLKGIDESIASSLILADMAPFMAQKCIHDKVMLREYQKNFGTLHKKLLKHIRDYYSGVKIASFSPCDPISFVEGAPDDCILVIPPPLQAFYGPTNSRINEVVSWAAPKRQILNAKTYQNIMGFLEKKREWIVATPFEIPEVKPLSIVAQGRSGPLIKVYQSSGNNFLVRRKIETEPLDLSRLSGEMDGDLRIMKISAGQMDLLRSEYLDPKIIPSPSDINLAVMVGSDLIGALGFSMPNSGRSWNGIDLYDAFMIADFAIRPTIYKRISKLVLVAALSKEVHELLEEMHIRKIYKIGSTVFSAHEESMKYRELFEIASERKSGGLLYVADAGRWTLQEGFEWWKKKHGQTKTS